MALKNLKFFLFFLILLIFLNLFSKPVRNFFYLLISPLQIPSTAFFNQISKYLSFFVDLKKCSLLEKESLELLQQNLQLKELQKENEFLKEALNLKKEQKENFLVAKVVQKNLAQNSLILNKGKKEGVKENFFAFLPQKVAVGKVTEVFDDFCKITTLFSKELEFDVKIPEKEIFGKAKGNQNEILVSFLEKKEEVEVGDKVVTSGFQIFPEGLLVGEIVEKSQKETSPYLETKVKPFFSFFDLNFLLLKEK